MFITVPHPKMPIYMMSNSWDICPRKLFIVNLIDQRPDVLNVYSHIISVSKNDLWLPGHSNARACPCEDDSAPLQGCSL